MERSWSNSLKMSPKCISSQASTLINWQHGTVKRKKTNGWKIFLKPSWCHHLTLSQRQSSWRGKSVNGTRNSKKSWKSNLLTVKSWVALALGAVTYLRYILLYDARILVFPGPFWHCIISNDLSSLRMIWNKYRHAVMVTTSWSHLRDNLVERQRK